MIGLPTRLVGPLALVRELVTLGAHVVVVGSTADRLNGFGGCPRDLDVVVPDRSVRELVHALRQLNVRGADTLLRRRGLTTVHTGWCPLDVFLAEPPRSSGVELAGTVVQVLV